MKQHMALSNQFTSVHEKTLNVFEFEQAPSATPKNYLDANERLLSLQVGVHEAARGGVQRSPEDQVVPITNQKSETWMRNWTNNWPACHSRSHSSSLTLVLPVRATRCDGRDRS